MEHGVLEKHLPTIEKYARVCLRKVSQPSLLEVDDLINEGAFVLCKALEKFDTSRNTSFSAYLKTCLKCHFAGIVSASYNKIPAMCQSDELSPDLCQIEREQKMVSIPKATHFMDNLKKLSQEQIELFLFYLKPPDFIVDKLLKHPKRQIEIIREVIGISEYRERKLRREMLEVLLS